MGYFINQIKDNVHNHYKYQYLDHLQAIIDLKDNYWSCYMQLICINDCSLPLGATVCSLNLPYQEVKDITFNLASDQSDAPSLVEYNKNYAKIYDSQFNIDISQNEFFKQDINNTKITCSIKMEIDPQILKNAGASFDQVAVDSLINETSEQKWDFSMYYTNTNLVQSNKTFNNQFGYTLNNGNDCLTKYRLVDVACNDYSANQDSITCLTTITSDTPFQVISAKVKFYYWLELDTEQRVLDSTLLVNNQLTNMLNIDFNQNTLFDFINNKVTLDSGGICGFYIPKMSHGYYELELLVNQDDNFTKLIIQNPFNFVKDMSNPYMGISHIEIDNIDDFKRTTFDD